MIPCYVLAGRAAISATMGVATTAPVGYTPWFAVMRVLHLAHATGSINALGLIAFVGLAVILLWRMPSGPVNFPAVRVALAVTLAWLLVTPQQHSWYFAMIFPLVAVMPAQQAGLDRGRLVPPPVPGLNCHVSMPVTQVHPVWLSRSRQKR